MRTLPPIFVGVLLVVGIALVGCSGAEVKADIHAGATGALGLITLAEEHPELLDSAKQAVGALAQKVDPKDASTVQAVSDALNSKNFAAAKAGLKPIAIASAPVAVTSAAPVSPGGPGQ